MTVVFFCSIPRSPPPKDRFNCATSIQGINFFLKGFQWRVSRTSTADKALQNPDQSTFTSGALIKCSFPNINSQNSLISSLSRERSSSKSKIRCGYPISRPVSSVVSFNHHKQKSRPHTFSRTSMKRQRVVQPAIELLDFLGLTGMIIHHLKRQFQDVI